MRRPHLFFFPVFLIFVMVLASCSGSNNEPYYYDPAAIGPDGEPVTEQVGNAGNQNRSDVTYTQRRPVTSEPKPWESTGESAPPTARYPSGTKVSGKPGLVKSPYAPYAGDVDVQGIPSGTQVKCPYTGKIFIVP